MYNMFLKVHSFKAGLWCITIIMIVIIINSRLYDIKNKHTGSSKCSSKYFRPFKETCKHAVGSNKNMLCTRS
jgi:hypothetical protein